MLAYVFWHWPQSDHVADEYERAQRAFHQALATAAPAGFLSSVVSLFTLRGDRADLTRVRHATFLTKPRDMPYDAFYAEVEPHNASVWRRQLVLGPTPEFCLLSSAPVEVAATFQPLQLQFHQL